MKIKNIIAALLAFPVLAGMVACSEEEADYTAAGAVAGKQVFFANTVNSTIELSAEANSVSLPLNRVDTVGALSVPLKSTSTSEDIEVAPTAEFANGAAVANIAISYDPEKIVAGKYDTVTIAIADEFTTPYGSSNITLLVGQKEPWISLGTGYFYDGFQDDYLWAVTIEQNQLNPSNYRVVAPYRGMWNYWGEGDFAAASADYFNFRILEQGSTLAGVTVPEDGLIYFEPANSGYFHDTYGDYIWTYHPAHFTIASEELYANNYIAAYQEDGTPGDILLAPYYYIPGVGGWNNTTSPGMVEIIMPGFELSDYTVEVSYGGKYYDAEDNLYAVASIDYLGEDVAEVQLVVTAGRNSAQAGIDAILSEAEGVVTATAEGRVNVPMPADAVTGDYTVTAVTFDAEGEPQEYGAFTFSYTASNYVPEAWTQIGTGTYTYSQFFEGDDEGLEIFQSEDDPSRFKIEHWGYDVDFIFTLNENNEISFEEFYIGYDDSSYGEVWAYDMNAEYPDNFPAGYYADGVYHFQIGYGVEAGWFGYGEETFTLDAAAKARAAKASTKTVKAKKAPAKMNRAAQNNGMKKVRKVNAVKAQVRAAKPSKATPSYDLFSKYAK